MNATSTIGGAHVAPKPVLVRCELCTPPFRLTIKDGSDLWYAAMDHALDVHPSVVMQTPAALDDAFKVSAVDSVRPLRACDTRRPR